MKKKKGKDDFIRRHEYPGGKSAFMEFIKTNLSYPKEALENKIEGAVLAEYSVGFDGKVKDVKIVHGIGSGCDEEAIRLIKLLKFAPQNNHGTKISSNHKIKINFKLPVQVKQPTATTIKYNVTANKEKKNSKKGISYSIQIKHP
jgi:protein TonB